MKKVAGIARITAETPAGQVAEWNERFSGTIGDNENSKQAAENILKRQLANEAVLVIEIMDLAVERLVEPHDAVEQFINVE